MDTTNTRAKKGGQVAASNGHFYRGGQFLPSTSLAPGMFNVGGRRVKARSYTIAPGVREVQPTATARAIYPLVSPLIDWQGYRATGALRLFPAAIAYYGATVKLGGQEFTAQELLDQYQAGARWIDPV